MSFLTAQNEIVAELRSIPFMDVYEGQMSDEQFTELLINTDQIKPFITVNFGGMVETSRRHHGIAGAKYDSNTMTTVVRAIANTDKNSRIVMDQIWKKLVGFEPVNCGELRAALFGGVGEVSILGVPTRYAAVQTFTNVINSDVLT